MFQRRAAHTRNVSPATNVVSSSRKTSVEIRRSTATALALLGLALLFVDFLLLKQNVDLRALSRERLEMLGPRPGRVVPGLSGVDVSGKRLVVGYGKDPRSTVLFVFSPGCPACKLNWPAWKTLVGRINKDAFRLVFVDLSPQLPRGYLRRHGVGGGYPVFAKLDPNVRDEYSLHMTPQLVLVGREGKIEKVWTGALGSRRLREVESQLVRSGSS